MGPGEDIRVMSEAAARAWMERHAGPEEYEQAFGAAESA